MPPAKFKWTVTYYGTDLIIQKMQLEVEESTPASHQQDLFDLILEMQLEIAGK